MFEFSIALKYLLPRAKKLSVSLVAFLSIGMISLIVWLILVFLSVTEGIEQGWLSRLTKLHGSVSITPTEHYYASYYYKIDSCCLKSGYSSKNLQEKLLSNESDPFNPEEDGELPYRFPEKDCDLSGKLKDPVKGLYHILGTFKQKGPGFSFQDYEVSGALLRLQLLREHGKGESQSFLTQASYVSSFPGESAQIGSLILPPRAEDAQNLLFLASYQLQKVREDTPSFAQRHISSSKGSELSPLLQAIQIQKVTPKASKFPISLSAFPIGTKLKARALIREGHVLQIEVPSSKTEKTEEILRIEQKGPVLVAGGKVFPLEPQSTLHLVGPLEMKAQIVSAAHSFDDNAFKVTGSIQGYAFETIAKGKNLKLKEIKPITKAASSLPWVSQTQESWVLPQNEEGSFGVLLARSFQEGGVLLGDHGYLAYQTMTTGSLQEQRIPVFVAGFYDPGVLSIGNKLIFVPKTVSRTLYAGASSSLLNTLESSGVHIWLSDYHTAEKVQKQLCQALEKAGLSDYWKVSTFKEYPFAKDLLGQFESDKTLFVLVGIIILLVACGNIISLLILLVSDKKKEIGILRALGASSQSIAAIFGSTGMMMGLISSIIGVVCALITMRYIDVLVSILSFFQGRSAFNPAFYGEHLPKEISFQAIVFVLIATPLLALLAGLIPAIKACRLKTSEILRSQ